jgi:D-amino-acid oxidase
MIPMKYRTAIVGAGVSGLTCGVVFAERGYQTTIFAEKIGQQTTSAAAAALWFPYDVEPANKVIPWALETFRAAADLAQSSESGVSIIELRQFSRSGEIHIPDWAIPLGANRIPLSVTSSKVETSPNRWCGKFAEGFALSVPLTDTTIYLDYLAKRFLKADGQIIERIRFEALEDVDSRFDLVINCAGIGARELVHDADLQPHRGQVAIVAKIEGLPCAVVCDDTPLMYAIPRARDCVFGGTNEVSNDLAADPATTARIVAECSRALMIEKPKVLTERVGLRPFRKSGVRVERDCLRDSRTVIHNYGHGGSGFTLSWGCANAVFQLAT